MKNNNYYNVLLKKILNETLEDKAKEVMEKLKFNKPGTSFDYVEGEMCESCGGEMREGEMCESCGGEMREGEMCESCGGEMREGEACESCGYSENSEVLETRKSYRNNNKLSDSDIEEITERLFGKQKNIDKNKRETKENKGECIECGDKSYMEEEETYEGNAFTKKLKQTPKGGKFKLGNKEYTDNSSLEEEETYEGNAFTKKLKQTPKGGKFKLGNKEYTDNSSLEENNNVLYRLNSGHGSELFTENEIINLIENIIIEEKEKNNIKKGKTPAGLEAYEKAHKGSGKENENYMKEFSKKMLDYTKSGSKEKFNTNPKHFPKGNGELEKMEKKAYEVSDDGNQFIDDYLRPGMQTLDYDEIHPNEDWMDDNIEGSSKTGNNKEWVNSEETDINKNINKTRKKGNYNKAKRVAYNKSPQPIISDKPGQETGNGLKLNNESVDHKSQIKLTEEFNRMKLLMGYKEKTQ